MHQESDESVDIISVTSTEVGPKKNESQRHFKRHHSVTSSWNVAKKRIEQWGHPKKASIIILSWGLIGLLLDPLFLYIPTIDDKNKCLEMNTKLSIAAITLRSLLDLPFFLYVIMSTCENIGSGFKSDFKPDPGTLSVGLRRGRIPTKAIPFLLPISHLIALAKALVAVMRLFNRNHVVFLFSILPIPQVAMVVFFFKMRSAGYFYRSAILNAFLFLQYLPKLLLMYDLADHLLLTRKWVKSLLNLVLYICASHVLGAFWYFFSVQRETICWHQACRNTPGCTTAYYCDDTSHSKNIGILNELCPINPENATIFDFGIFLDAFQSGTTGQINFSSKLFYCLWWGLRNLSNFGTNLETSNYMWENCFAILISISGLLLFLCFIGNVQTYIELEVMKGEEIRELKSKMTKKKPVIESWMKTHHLPLDIRKEIFGKQNSGESMKENIDVDVDVKGQLSILSKYYKDLSTEHLCMYILKKVPKFRDLDVGALRRICEYLKPVIYTENSYVVQEGKPLGLMLFIIDGTIWTYKTNGDNATGSSSMIKIKWLEKGDFYGQELLSYWALPNCSFSHLPISAEDVQCQTKVEAFALMAKDLRTKDLDSMINSIATC